VLSYAVSVVVVVVVVVFVVVVVSRCCCSCFRSFFLFSWWRSVEMQHSRCEIFLDFPSLKIKGVKRKKKKKQSRMSLSLAASWCVSSSSSSSSCSVTIAHFRSFFPPRLFCKSMAREFSLLHFYFAVKFRTSSRPREMDISFFRVSACS